MGLDWPRYSFLSRVDHQASGCASSTHPDATTFYFRHTNTQWHPSNERQERLIASGGQRASASAAWLYENRRDLFFEFGATR